MKQFCSIVMENSTSVSNQKYGIGVIGFYGTVTIKNSQCSENESDGIVLAKTLADFNSVNRSEVGVNEDEAQLLDYVDCTDRSSKRNALRSRSPTILHPTEQAMLEGHFASYRGGEGEPSSFRMLDQSLSLLERPFEKQIGIVHLLKCVIQQNRRDGIKSVDYNVRLLGCTIKLNMSSSVRLYSPEKGASCDIYMKSSRNESDLITHVV